MSDHNKNIDSFLDEKFRSSLSENTSSDFTFELMKRVQLQKEFATEDLRTDRMVKYVIGGVFSLMVIVTLVLGMVLKTNDEGKEVSYVNNFIGQFSEFLEKISLLTMENLGFAFNLETGIIVLLLMICVFIYSFADKNLFKKKLKH